MKKIKQEPLPPGEQTHHEVCMYVGYDGGCNGDVARIQFHGHELVPNDLLRRFKARDEVHTRLTTMLEGARDSLDWIVDHTGQTDLGMLKQIEDLLAEVKGI